MTNIAYIQVGVTALRDPVTGAVMRAVPMYARADDLGAASEAEAMLPMLKDAGEIFAAPMAAYIEGCKAKGLPI